MARPVLAIRVLIVLSCFVFLITRTALGQCVTQNRPSVQILKAEQSEVEGSKAEQQKLEGAYELVSETTILANPKRVTLVYAPPHWGGLWLFQGGYYSKTLMKKRRGFLTYPRYHSKIGYESFAGIYKVDRNKIELQSDLSLHPLHVGDSKILEFRLEGDLLTLIETLHPYVEDTSQGQIITVLRRIK